MLQDDVVAWYHGRTILEYGHQIYGYVPQFGVLVLLHALKHEAAKFWRVSRVSRVTEQAEDLLEAATP